MSDLFQSVPFAVVLLIIGFVFLVKGADAFVEGCSSIARRYHVPSLIIGMTIVAMGTSLPETAVSVTAAVTGNNALAVSNAVGSNIFNLMVVVGACTLFTSVAVQINTLKIDFPISILCAILLLILGAAGMSLGHIDGVVFIILFLSFILYMIRSAQASREKNVEPGVEEEEYLLEAEEGHHPESKGAQDLAEVGDAEGIVFLFSLAGLGVEFLVHEEIDDKHDEGHHEEHNAEGHRTRHADVAAEIGHQRREDHTRAHTETGKRHFRAHGHGHLASLEPFHDSTAHRNAGHLHAAAEDHEADGRELGGCRHAFIERRDAQLVEARDVVEMVGKPYVEAAAEESVGERIPVDCGAHEHHTARKHGREPHAHLVEDDTCEDEEEDEHVEEGLGALHRTEGCGVPASGRLQEVFDRGEDVHKYIRTEHGEGEQAEGKPTGPCLVAERSAGSRGVESCCGRRHSVRFYSNFVQI